MTPPHPYDEKKTWGYRMKLMTINPAAENDGLWHTTDVMNGKNGKHRKKRDGRQTVTHDTDVTLTDTELKRATITPVHFLHRHTCGVCGRDNTHRTASGDKRTDSLASDSGRNSHVHLHTQYGHPLNNVLLHTAGGYSEHLRDLFVGEVFDIAFLQDKLCARRQCLSLSAQPGYNAFRVLPICSRRLPQTACLRISLCQYNALTLICILCSCFLRKQTDRPVSLSFPPAFCFSIRHQNIRSLYPVTLHYLEQYATHNSTVSHEILKRYSQTPFLSVCYPYPIFLCTKVNKIQNITK